jgi:hypothetical protein
VFVGNKGTIEVSGDTVIDGNEALDGEPNNLVVHDRGRMVLAGKMTGAIGYTEGVAGDECVFGRVAAGVSEADALESAHNFTHDCDGDVGMAVKGADGTLLVWSAALDDDGTYTDEDGEEYTLADGDALVVAVPAAAVGLVYDGDEQTGVDTDIAYTVVGNTAVDAGDYTATLTLRPGFTWDDGSTGVKTIEWSIAKAVYDMSGVAFADKTCLYNGQYQKIEISGELPDGVTVAYVNNRQRDIGEYAAVACYSPCKVLFVLDGHERLWFAGVDIHSSDKVLVVVA